jgi:signal transduction histidine kinase
VNELATNAVKYGFNDDEPGVFRLASEYDGSDLILAASNTGNPLPQEITLDRSETLGLQLVRMLVEQLGGTASLQPTPQALRMRGISKSQVSRVCGEIDERAITICTSLTAIVWMWISSSKSPTSSFTAFSTCSSLT